MSERSGGKPRERKQKCQRRTYALGFARGVSTRSCCPALFKMSREKHLAVRARQVSIHDYAQIRNKDQKHGVSSALSSGIVPSSKTRGNNLSPHPSSRLRSVGTSRSPPAPFARPPPPPPLLTAAEPGPSPPPPPPIVRASSPGTDAATLPLPLLASARSRSVSPPTLAFRLRSASPSTPGSALPQSSTPRARCRRL